jgi:BR serine/threonine kinase
MASVDSTAARCVGPYLLTRTLGKGQTGVVKLGIHCTTGKHVAVKIVNRSKLSQSVLNKVEREIAIMKLVNHPNVLGLYDVYENNSYLYLVLDYVAGGELFDYLVKRVRLPEREARRFFRQIISAVDFCHKHQICHRDLKPENLLLDEHRNIKVADFGMASLQVHDQLLETSCGSPHYACPEVIRGEHYDGKRADVWSCGVILYALIVGQLPFDDDNLRILLEKVKKGTFSIPSFVSVDAQNLIRGMVDTNQSKRFTMDQVLSHPWTRGTSNWEGKITTPFQDRIETVPLTSVSEIDTDIIKSMASLGCFKDKTALIKALMQPGQTEEKVIYFLLLYRKEKKVHEGVDPDADQVTGCLQKDPPRKRIELINPTQSLPVLQRVRSNSVSTSPYSSPTQSPDLSKNQRLSVSGSPVPTRPGYFSYQGSPVAERKPRSSLQTVYVDNPTGSPWRKRLSSTIKTAFGSPHFHRKKLETPQDEAVNGLTSPDPEPVKRSWFANFLSSSNDKSEVILVVNDKNESELRVLLSKAFDVCNFEAREVDDSTYKIRYESKGKKSLMKKVVKFTLHFVATEKGISNGTDPPGRNSSAGVSPINHTLTFTLISGGCVHTYLVPLNVGHSLFIDQIYLPESCKCGNFDFLRKS